MLNRRLACLPLLTFLSLPLFAAESRWILETRDAPDGGAAKPVLAQVSAVAIADEYGSKQVNPEIQFHCSGGELLARIHWHRFISSFNTELGFKADNGRNKWHKWKVDRSNQVTISPSADDTAVIIEKMLAGKILTVDVTPYSEAPVQVQFDLAGFTEAIDSFRADCG